MDLSDRIKIIITENNLRQKAFAQSINVTDSYISKLLRNESGLSNSTAALIEERYGYSSDWILSGEKPKMKNQDQDQERSISINYKKILTEIEEMNEYDLIAVRAFINSLGDIKNSIKK